MSKKEQKIAEWLEKLQQESWNLELLISGFSIFLLIQVGDELGHVGEYVRAHYRFGSNIMGIIITFLGILRLAAIVLTFNLIIHILMRGFWIGAIGLRSVQKKIDISRLNYSDFFQEKLKGNIISLDELLTRVDNFSSVIFSFSFLIVFMLISLFLGFSFIGFVVFLFNKLLDPLSEGWLSNILEVVMLISVLGLLLTGLIYTIDTLSLGFFKRYRWLSRIYYPIYRFFSWISLAKVYRGIYYSIITKYPKSRIRFFLLIYISALILIPFHKYDQYLFYPDNSNIDQILESNLYDNIRTDEWISTASIPARIVKDAYLPLFIRYDVRDNEAIKKQCKEFNPAKKEGITSGISFRGGIRFSDPRTIEPEPQKLLECLSSYYNIYINDSLQTDLDFWFYQHPNKGELGIMTVLDVDAVNQGRNTVKITQNDFQEVDEVETPSEIDLIKIPFWIEQQTINQIQKQ